MVRVLHHCEGSTCAVSSVIDCTSLYYVFIPLLRRTVLTIPPAPPLLAFMRYGRIILLVAASLMAHGTANTAELNLNANSFVVEAGNVEVGVWANTRQYANVKASARLVNRSGVAVSVGLKGESTSIDTCTGQERSTGLDVI